MVVIFLRLWVEMAKPLGRNGNLFHFPHGFFTSCPSGIRPGQPTAPIWDGWKPPNHPNPPERSWKNVKHCETVIFTVINRPSFWVNQTLTEIQRPQDWIFSNACILAMGHSYHSLQLASVCNSSSATLWHLQLSNNNSKYQQTMILQEQYCSHNMIIMIMTITTAIL